MIDFVAIDFETANAKRTSACSLGLVFVENGYVVNDMEFLIKPFPFEFNPYNVNIHGITESDVVNAPTFDTLWDQLYPLLQDKLIVAHNASFDISVLHNMLTHYNIKIPGIEYLCTFQLSKKAFPQLASHRLDVVAAHCDIAFHHHDALADADACAQILCKVFNDTNFSNFDELNNYFNVANGFFDELSYYPCRSFQKSTESEAAKQKVYKSAKEFWGINDVCIDDDFVDKHFCFTGTLLSMTRSKAWEIVATGGGFPQNGINKATNYLVVGLQDYTKLNGTLSNKMKKAYELKEKGQDIIVIAEDEFLSMIDDALYKKCGLSNLLTV